jgi:galactose-1-phosphate uridylyltransferase
MQGYGHHEVIIETPRHNQQFVATPPHMRINHRCLRRTLRSSMGIEYVFVQHFNRLQTVLLSSAL